MILLFSVAVACVSVREVSFHVDLVSLPMEYRMRTWLRSQMMTLTRQPEGSDDGPQDKDERVLRKEVF